MNPLFWDHWWFSAGIILTYMSFLFVYATVQKRSDIVDIGWGLGFAIVAITTYWRIGTTSWGGYLLLTLVLVWGCWLTGRVFLKNRRGEKNFYEAWRGEWGKWFYIKVYANFFLLPGLLLMIIIIPAIYGLVNYPALSALTIAGAGVWLVGFYFSVLGKYRSLHLVWWGVYLIALSTPGSGWTIVGPATAVIVPRLWIRK